MRQGGRIPASRHQKGWIGTCLANLVGAAEAGRGVLEAEALSVDGEVQRGGGAEEEGTIEMAGEVAREAGQGW